MSIFTTVCKSLMELQQADNSDTVYRSELQGFYSKIENQVILDRNRLRVNLCDMILTAKIF